MASTPHALINRINREYERAFSTAAKVAKEMECSQQALLAAKHVFSHNPNNEDVLRLFPHFRPLIDRLCKFVESLGSQLIRDPEDEERWAMLGACYLILGDFPNAFAACSHVLRLSPATRNNRLWYIYGVIQGYYNYIDQAIFCFKRVLGREPGFCNASDILIRLGILYRMQEKFESSVDCFDTVLTNIPVGMTRDDILLQKAYSLELKGDKVEATELYKSLIEKHPNNVKIVFQYFLFLFKMRMNTYDDFLFDMVSKSIDTFPPYWDLILIKIRLLMRKERHQDAYNLIKLYLPRFKEAHSLWLVLGVLYIRHNQHEDAIKAFQTAINLKYDCTDAWLGLGYALELMDDSKMALEVYKKGAVFCPRVEELEDRMEKLKNERKERRTTKTCDVDDLELFISIAQQAGADYIKGTPVISGDFMGEELRGFECMATSPLSIFV